MGYVAGSITKIVLVSDNGLQKLKPQKPDGGKYMKVHTLFALILLVLAGATATHSQETTHNGYWWVNLSRDFKLGFVTGFAMAMTGNLGCCGREMP